MIDGFDKKTVELEEARISVHTAGVGAPLLLLHGFPQNHMTWEKVAPGLARHFRVIVADLPGYGESRVLREMPDHAAYSKRHMAKVLVETMARLGHARFHLLGHDRGARVAYRMALDHPQVVDRLGIIEVVPTVEMWTAFDADMALMAYHWPFLAQPAPLPETLIGGAPGYFLDHTLSSWTLERSLAPFSARALASYRAQMSEPARLHAMCEDYRAGAGFDRALDSADLAAGNRIAAPLHFIWAPGGFPARTGAPLEIWGKWAETVTGNEITAGHFVPEEAPQAVLESYLPFFG